MALAVVSNEVPNIRQSLDQLQLDQFRHDEAYHREIARLTVQDRLKHMALHFAKYAGNLAEVRADEAQVQRIVTDVFVIGMSCANILNLRLPEALPDSGKISLVDGEVGSFLIALTINAGRMAAACEKLDHLEDFPFRITVAKAVVALVENALQFAEAHSWDLAELVRSRLAAIKEKMIFHGRI